MRLAITNKSFDEEFRTQSNVKVQNIEDAIDTKIKKLTETTHYDELKAEVVPVSIYGDIKRNNSWRIDNLVCLDFETNETNNTIPTIIDREERLQLLSKWGSYRTFGHNLNISETKVFNVYAPEGMAMYKLGVWAVFKPDGTLVFEPYVPRTYTFNIERGGLGIARSVAVNCLVILN